MRIFWLAVVAVAALSGTACSRKRVKVADTVEGNACRRECMQIYQSCMGARGGGKYVCRGEENRCLSTCPDVVH